MCLVHQSNKPSSSTNKFINSVCKVQCSHYSSCIHLPVLTVKKYTVTLSVGKNVQSRENKEQSSVLNNLEKTTKYELL